MKESTGQVGRTVSDLLKRQNEMLGSSLLNLDQLLYLHKSLSLLSFKEIKEVLVDKLPHMLSIRHFTLFLYDKGKRLLSLACHNHPSLSEGLSIHLYESGIMHDALTQGRYILEPDFSESKYFKGKKNPLFRNDFFVCIPLMIENEIIGALNLNDNEKGFFSVSDLDFVLNVTEFISVSISNALLYEKIEILSITDGLTGLCNHQEMRRVLKSEFARSKRYDSPLSLVIMDLDDFKKINDTYGHQMGDEVLIELAGVMKRVCRSNDTAARYGGEEFTLILPETKVAGAMNIAERVCNELAQCRFQYDDDEFCVTISAGVVEYDDRIKSPVHMIKLADKALYKAKDLGKNQTYQSVPEDDSAN